MSTSSDLAATSSFTLMVFDMSSGKITCSLVSKDRGISPDNSSINTKDAVSYLTEEIAKLASKKIVSAGLFNVWKGLFKWIQCWLDIIIILVLWLEQQIMKILRYFSSKCKEFIKIHCSLTDSETNIGYLLSLKIMVIMIRKFEWYLISIVKLYRLRYAVKCCLNICYWFIILNQTYYVFCERSN